MSVQGFDPARLARIKTHFAAYVQDGRLPGWQVQVSRRGEIVYRENCGHRDLEAKLPIEDDTVFRIYSMTKPITSVAFMMLVEEGKVDSTIRSIALFPNGRTSACSTLASQAVF